MGSPLAGRLQGPIRVLPNPTIIRLVMNFLSTIHEVTREEIIELLSIPTRRQDYFSCAIHTQQRCGNAFNNGVTNIYVSVADSVCKFVQSSSTLLQEV